MNRLSIDSFLPAIVDVLPSVLFVLAATILLIVILYLLLYRGLKHRHALPVMMLAPGMIGLALLFVYPFLYNLYLTTGNLNLPRLGLFIKEPLRDLQAMVDQSSVEQLAFGFSTMLKELASISPQAVPNFGIGEFFNNIARLFTTPILQQEYFLPVLGRTFVWGGVQVAVQFVIAFLIAGALNRKLRLKAMYRTLILVPWAIPGIILILSWRTEFQYEYGAVNSALRALFGEGAAVRWFSEAIPNWLAINVVNIWLSVPFLSAAILSILQSLDPNLFEAAKIDGARGIAMLRRITLPLIQPSISPLLLLNFIWCFQNFGVSYFINANGLESSEILVTALFRAGFQYNRYSYAAMLALVLFIIMLVITLIGFKLMRKQLNSDAGPAMGRVAGN